MNQWMDKLENVGAELQELGKKAFDAASDGIEKAKPIVKDKIEDAMEACEKAKPIIEEGIEKAVGSLRTAVEKARPAIEEGMEKAANSAKEFLNRVGESEDDSPEAEENSEEAKEAPELTQEQEIELDVSAQLEKIKAAVSAPNMISDFIKSKYGKDE